MCGIAGIIGSTDKKITVKMINNKTRQGTLKETEPHPAAYIAKEYINSLTTEKLLQWRGSFSSCAIEGNRLAEVCCETLNRLLKFEPVSDRYLLGLAWTMKFSNNLKNEK